MKLMRAHNLQTFAAIIFTLLIFVGFTRADSDREADVQKYINTFTNASQLEQKNAAEALSWEGLSDTRIFDVAEKNLLQNYQGIKQRSDADYCAWMAKALGYSGLQKYRATLEKVAEDGPSGGLRNHAKAALEMLPTYAKWNSVIADKSQYAADKSPEINRLANMLRSKEKGLQEIAARQIIEKPIKDEFILDIVQKMVEPDLAQSWSDQDDIKTVAYMLKALAAGSQPKYRATVEQAAVSAATPKVRKYAEGYLKKY